jgi:hypothetical protein
MSADKSKQTDGVQGEGNYEAAREYNERTRRFIDSGRVDEAAREAEPDNAEEAKELKEAEEAGKRRAKKQPADPAPD